MKSQSKRSNQGFTLFEVVFVALIIGILSAIAAPSWLAFVDTRRLTTAQDQVYRAMREAQSNAKRDKVTWQASFREKNGVVLWMVHRADFTPPDPPDNPPYLPWQNFDPNVRLDSETDLTLSNSVRQVLFNYQGCPVYNPGADCGTLGRITLSSNNGGTAKRCVIVSTLLGALRTAKEQPQTDSAGRYCY